MQRRAGGGAEYDADVPPALSSSAGPTAANLAGEEDSAAPLNFHDFNRSCLQEQQEIASKSKNYAKHKACNSNRQKKRYDRVRIGQIPSTDDRPKQRFDDDITDSDASIPEDRSATVLGGPVITGSELVDLMRHISVAQELTSNPDFCC